MLFSPPLQLLKPLPCTLYNSLPMISKLPLNLQPVLWMCPSPSFSNRTALSVLLSGSLLQRGCLSPTALVLLSLMWGRYPCFSFLLSDHSSFLLHKTFSFEPHAPDYSTYPSLLHLSTNLQFILSYFLMILAPVSLSFFPVPLLS